MTEAVQDLYGGDERLYEIGQALKGMGYWYPPDGIRAVIEGRAQYVNLAGEAHELRDAMAANIKTAIEQVDKPQPPDEWTRLSDEQRALRHQKKAKG